MAIATRSKPKTAAYRKRMAQHHRQDKHYLKSYWPYLPLLAIVGLGIMINSVWNTTHVLGANSGLSASSLLADTNNQRLADKEANLTLNDQLAAAAQAKANDMVASNYWSHDAPDGKTPWTFITDAGYQYQAAGENLAYGFTSAGTVLNAWMHSPEHRANILDDQYQNVGFGIASSPNYVGSGPQTIIVAEYGAPATVAAANPQVLADNTTEPVSRFQLVSNTTSTSAMVVAIVGSLALILVLIRHGIAWRRLIIRGEYFVIRHPLFDMALVAVATLALLLNHTVGFIH